MSDLIKREDAIGACAYETIECYEARKAIRALPSADRPQGKWIEHERAEEVNGMLISNYECSYCHEWERKASDYCPNCGCRMKGADDE